MKRLKKKSGFSLVEIILSVAILSFLSIFILQMFTTARTLNDRADALDESVLLAESIFERIQANGSLELGLERGGYSIESFKETPSEKMASLYFDASWLPVTPEQAVYEAQVSAAMLEDAVEYRIEIYAQSEAIYEMEMRQYNP